MTFDEQKNTGMQQNHSSGEGQKDFGSKKIDDPKPAGDEPVEQSKVDTDA